jgi:hypothetical protein
VKYSYSTRKSHGLIVIDDPVSLTKDSPKIQALEEIGAPDKANDIIIQSIFISMGIQKKTGNFMLYFRQKKAAK